MNANRPLAEMRAISPNAALAGAVLERIDGHGGIG